MATVVLDNGAGLAKVGLSTDKAPRYFIFCTQNMCQLIMLKFKQYLLSGHPGI